MWIRLAGRGPSSIILPIITPQRDGGHLHLTAWKSKTTWYGLYSTRDPQTTRPPRVRDPRTKRDEKEAAAKNPITPRRGRRRRCKGHFRMTFLIVYDTKYHVAHSDPSALPIPELNSRNVLIIALFSTLQSPPPLSPPSAAQSIIFDSNRQVIITTLKWRMLIA